MNPQEVLEYAKNNEAKQFDLRFTDIPSLQHHVSYPIGELTESSFEELGIDSMDAVNIVFALENEFNINVPDEEMKNIRSVRDIVEGVHKLVSAKPPDGPEKAAA